MSRLFALADLHLSLNGEKPMDIFGELWRDHPGRMAEAWDRLVRDEDTVLLAGDLSWARDLESARVDLDWIGHRPGRKLLLRGNHDAWWSSMKRTVEAVPEGCELLQNNAIEIGEWVLVGARGWLAPDDPIATPKDAKVFRRELERLRLSIRDADTRFGRTRPRLAMLHYPPWIVDRSPTALVPMLQRAGVRHCIYGHLHGDDHRLAVTGEHGGIRFHFVAADAVGFSPVEIRLAPSGAPR